MQFLAHIIKINYIYAINTSSSICLFNVEKLYLLFIVSIFFLISSKNIILP